MMASLGQFNFGDQHDCVLQKLKFIGELVDANERMIAAKEGLMDLVLTNDTLPHLKSNGVNAMLA
jgi:hypothetical protein